MEEVTNTFFAVPCPQECLSGIPGIGHNQHFIFAPTTRNDYAVMDAVKVADVVCFVMSCKGTDHLNIKLDPDKYCRAIDDLGYKHINMLRAQGLPEAIGILQHIEEVPAKRQNLIKKFFQRYFESEFSQKEKFFTFNKKEEGGNYEATLKHMLRNFVSLIPQDLSWRKHRSYFIIDKYNYLPESDVMEAYGYVHGNYFTTRLPIHITGYGSFLLSQIKSEEDPLKGSLKTKRKEEFKEVLEVADESTQEALVFENPPDPFAAEQTWPTKEELKGAAKSRMITEDQKEAMEFEGMESGSEKVESEHEEEMGEVDEPKEESESDEDDNEEDENILPISGKHKKMTTLKERSEQDLEFPDEVDTPATQEANARFQRYKGLKSIKSTKWDPYENLPVSYSKLFEFKNFTQSRKLAIAYSEKYGLQLHGLYAKFSIKGLKPETIANHPKDVPIVSIIVIE
jgi:pre-rRNA-processing protein TSR1